MSRYSKGYQDGAADSRSTIANLREDLAQYECAVNLFQHCLKDEKRKHDETREKLKASVGLK